MYPSKPVHQILILGATGPLGILLTREALSHNLHPTLFVRNPSKLPQEISSHADVTIIKGTLSSSPSTLFPTLSSTPFKTIISALGPPTLYRTPTLEISNFYTTLLTHLSSPSVPHPTPYILAVTTPSFPAPEDRFSLLPWISTFLIWLVIPGHYHDVRANAAAFTESRGGEMRWTVYRVGHLEDEKERDRRGRVARAGFVGDGKATLWVEREEVARWVVRQAVAVAEGVEGGNLGGRWVGKCPLLFDA